MSKRRLAVILFADIAGYTARMQQDESLAQGQLQAFREAMQTQVAAHQGEIVHFYGDGCLVLFELPRDAAQAGIALQKNFQGAEIPVRIGIHSGTVNVDDEHVYGDAINVASRVESMSVPGAVLLSKRVRDELKNQTQFQLQSLGSFAFKNVEEPTEVFALANEGLSVPRSGDMKGKGEIVKDKKPSSRFMIRAFSVGFLAMLVGASLFWVYSAKQADSSTQLMAEIKASRIAVLPFENKTNRAEIDGLGDLAADYIIQGMMTMEDVQVVSYQTVQDHLESLGNSSQDFAERTGAQKLIRGSIYQEGDSLLVQSQIIDLASGSVEVALPSIKAPMQNQSKLVNELQARVLGFFQSQGEDYLQFTNYGYAPKLEAFKAYQVALQFWMNDDSLARLNLEKAILLDSTYFWPHQLYFWSWSNPGLWGKADSVARLIDRRFPHLNPYEQRYQEFNRNLLAGKALKSVDILRQLHQKDPKHYFNNFIYGLVCMYANRPQGGIEAMSQLSLEYVPNETYAQNWWHGVYAFLLLRKNRDQEARNVLAFVPADNAHYVSVQSRLLYHAKQGQPDSASQYLLRIDKGYHSQERINWFYYDAGKYFGRYGDSQSQKSFAQALLARLALQDNPSVDQLKSAYALAEDYEQALASLTPLREEGGNPAGLLSAYGWLYAQKGDTARAKALLAQLEAQFPHEQHYFKARVLAALGEKAKALESLKAAFEAEKRYYNPGNYDFDFYLFDLLDYPPFVEAFVDPVEK